MSRKEAPRAPYVWVFYHFQNERGESAAHPNAFKVRTSNSTGGVCLRDVVESFPLSGTASFHFRFQTKGKFWLDLVDPDDRVPMVGESIQAKVLRFDQAHCSAHRWAKLKAGTPTPYFRTVQEIREVPAEAPPEGDLLFTEEEAHLPVPDVVDADLQGKSDYVKATVMARRNAERAKVTAAVKAVKDAEQAKMEAEREKDVAKSKHAAELKLWAEGGSGERKHVRALLANLHTILWEGANWSELPMSKLVQPAQVRKGFHKACRVVHPDKHNVMSQEQIFIASSVFHTLEQAFRTFSAEEM